MKFTKENMHRLFELMEKTNNNEACWRDEEYVKGYADAIKAIKFVMDVNMTEEGK